MINVIAAKNRVCYFCANKIETVDYKDIKTLLRFVSAYGKIMPRKKTGTCAKHQRKLARAIKQARHIALVPYTTRR